MKPHAFWGLVLLVLIIAGVALWVISGQPEVSNNGQAITTPNQVSTTTATTSATTTATDLKSRVVIDVPKSGASVPKTFTVQGKAPGPWYFEASFPIEVRSATGTVLVQTHATALTDWMTTADVAFKSDVSIPGTYKGPATLVLMRDNPSGLPEHDASVSIPIIIQ